MIKSWLKIKLFFIQAIVRYFKAILILVVLIIAAVGYYWLLLPEFKQTKAIGDLAKIENYQKYLEDYLSKLQELQASQSQLSREIQDKIKKVLPDEKDLAGLFVQLQALAEENGFILNSLDITEAKSESAVSQRNLSLAAEEELETTLPQALPSAVAPAAPVTLLGINKLNIAFEIAGGNYQALKNFLAAVEYNLRLFDVYEITFESVDGGPYAISLRTYYYSHGLAS